MYIVLISVMSGEANSPARSQTDVLAIANE